ncbi:hypothetical protein JOD97_002604 [Duganella sp. 1411]|uniref:hypothetical protein n=1 Tax=Duganella sp. 1411 TaxID=2806572 RepID=UPI001AE588C9|nr:hypothetical protein [Duganella sp. 1411]MBP1204562.1 hypothetical protein [Duganella sp. 1411]
MRALDISAPSLFALAALMAVDSAREGGQAGEPDVTVPAGGAPAPPAADLAHSKVRSSRLVLFAQNEWKIRPVRSLFPGGRRESEHLCTKGYSYTASPSNTTVLSPIVERVRRKRYV